MEYTREEAEKDSDESYKYLYNFCMDYCKDETDRQEFFKQLNKYVEAESELDKFCNI